MTIALFKRVTTDNQTIEYDEQCRLRIKDFGVTTSKIADLAVNTAKISDGSVTSEKLSDEVNKLLLQSFVAMFRAQISNVLEGNLTKLLKVDCNGDWQHHQDDNEIIVFSYSSPEPIELGMLHYAMTVYTEGSAGEGYVDFRYENEDGEKYGIRIDYSTQQIRFCQFAPELTCDTGLSFSFPYNENQHFWFMLTPSAVGVNIIHNLFSNSPAQDIGGWGTRHDQNVNVYGIEIAVYSSSSGTQIWTRKPYILALGEL